MSSRCDWFFLMYINDSFFQIKKYRAALLDFIDWLLLIVNFDLFKLHDEIYKSLNMLASGKRSTGVTIWMDVFFFFILQELKWETIDWIEPYWLVLGQHRQNVDHYMLLQVVMYVQGACHSYLYDKISNSAFNSNCVFDLSSRRRGLRNSIYIY